MSTDKDERILVVDDDPRNVRLLEGIFKTAGYSVEKAYSGAEALLRVEEAPPDLVLLDVMMPGMSGHEVCSRLKREESTRSIPVMLVTSLSSIDDKIEGLDKGAEDFVVKPVNRLELLAKTRSLLRIKMLHDEVTKAKEELERKNGELVRLEGLKDTLFQMIVHDLKNPLTAIMGNLSLALQLKGTLDPATEGRVKIALDSSRAMMVLILNLLDIGKMEENRMALEGREVSIPALFETALVENGGLIAHGRIVARSGFPAGYPSVWADPDLLGRVVANLLSNAIKHTGEGGVIEVGGEARERSVTFWVRDSGEGIPEEFQKVIFEKFAQADAKRHGLRTDRGLGLTFCKMAVEAHGGRIWVASEPGAGSTFFVEIPRVPSRGEATGESTPLIVSISARDLLPH